MAHRTTLLMAAALALAGVAPRGQAQTGTDGRSIGTGTTVLRASQPLTATPVSAPSPALRVAVIPCATPGADIRFRFSLPMHRVSPADTARFPEIAFSPGLDGSYRWTSDVELAFTPEPSSLEVGDWIEITVASAVPQAGENVALPGPVYASFRVENFLMATKVSSLPVVRGNPRFVAPLNAHSGMMGARPLLLLFDQPVSATAYTGLIKAALGRAALAVTVSSVSTIETDLDHEIDTRHVLAISVRPLPPDGSVVDLRIPTYESDGIRRETTSRLAVRTRLQWTSAEISQLQAGLAARTSQRVQVEFDNRVDLRVFQESLTVTPAPKAMDIRQTWHGTFVIDMELDTGTGYRMRLLPAFRDVAGNTPTPPLDVSFRSQDLEPMLQIPLTHLTLETGSNRLPVRVRNVRDIKVDVWRFPTASRFAQGLERAALGPSDYGITARTTVPMRVGNLASNAIHDVDLGIDTGPGLRLVEVSAIGTGSEAKGTLTARLLVQTTGMAVSTKVSRGALFVWVTDLASAQPVADARLSAYDLQSGRQIATAVSSNIGTATLQVGELATAFGIERPMAVVASRGADTSVSRIVEPELSHAWQFNLPATVEGAVRLDAAVFTDRGVYLPGDTVHVKVFARPVSTADSSPFDLEVRDPRGQRAFREVLEPDPYHGADATLRLPEGTPVGEYAATVRWLGASVQQTFRVEEYRVPTFTVGVASRDTEWRLGQNVAATVNAAYLQGGVLDGREVRWRVSREADEIRVPGLAGYVFSLERDTTLNGVFAQGRAALNATGEIPLQFMPEHASQSGLMTYTLEASVTDYDRQSYTGRLSRPVHGTSRYVGLRPPSRQVYRQGDKIGFPVVVVDTRGQVVPGAAVELFLDQFEYHTTTMLNDVGAGRTYNRRVISTQRIGMVTTAAAPVETGAVVPGAGAYRVRAVTRDPEGRLAASGFAVTVSGDQAVAWPRFDQDRIEVVADKESYRAGETATIVVQTPYRNALGLLTVETDGVLDHWVFRIRGDTPELKVPIKADYAPNAFVSFVLIRGREHELKDASGFETGAPGYKVGYTNLRVDQAANRLQVAIRPQYEATGPGQLMDVEIGVAGPDGRPTDASVAVMVVDEAVLSLTAYATPNPLELAFPPRTLGVRNASNILDLPHARRSRLEALFPGGDGAEMAFFGDTASLLRDLFLSTIYWNPSVVTGPTGKAVIQVTFPDNLTTFRIMAVASDRTGRMGSSDHDVIVRKPLMIQPVTPRFAYPGDTFNIEARVFNGLASQGRVVVSGVFDGLELIQEPTAAADVPANGSRSFSYRVRVLDGSQAATARFSATMGRQTDLLETTFPVLAAGNRRTVVQSGLVSAGSAVTLDIPSRRIPGTLNVEAVVSGTPLSDLKDAVQYLMQYPYGCIEQTTSTAYPLLVLQDLLPQIGVRADPTELRKMAESGVKRVLSFQTPSGGLAYWPDSTTPHAFGTVFGLSVLLEARKRGYDVPDASLGRVADYLEQTLQSGEITEEMPHGSIADADTRALMVLNLGRLGRPQPAYIQTLWRMRDKLTPFGLSFLAQAVSESTDRSLLEPILAEIRRAATVTSDEAYFTGQARGGWSLDSPLRSHGVALSAYATGSSSQELSGKLLRGLLNRRQGGLWGNTQENVYSIMGIYELVSAGGLSSGVRGVNLVLNGRRYAEREMERTSADILRLNLPEDALAGQSARIRATLDGAGQSHTVTLRATYDEPLDDEYRAARRRGYAITRSYETPDGAEVSPGQVRLGSIVRVRLMVVADQGMSYVVVDDRLPAGLEPLNVNLATTETVSQGRLTPAAERTLPLISYSETRNNRVVFHLDQMPAGQYELSYMARATTPGVFLRPAGRVEAMYRPEVYGVTSTDVVTIR